MTKWYVLATFSLMTLNQMALWFTFGCLEPKVVQNAIPGMNPDNIRWTLTLNPVCFFTFVPFVTMLATTPHGLRKCFRLSATLQVLAAILLSSVFFFEYADSAAAVPIIFLALVMNSMTNSIVTSLCIALAGEWFPGPLQGLAFSLCMAANVLGIVIWYPLGPILAPTADMVSTLVYIRLFLNVIPFALFWGHYPMNPRIENGESRNPSHLELPDPSNERQTQNDDDERVPFSVKFKHQMALLMRAPVQNKIPFFVTVLGCGFQAGVASGVAFFLQELLDGRYSATEIGWVGFMMTAAVVPATILGGTLSDRPYLKSRLFTVLFAVTVFQLLAGIAMVFTLYGGKNPPVATPLWAQFVVVFFAALTYGVSSTVNMVRAMQLAPDLPEAVIGFWSSLFNNIGNALIFVIPNDIMHTYGIFLNVTMLVLLMCALSQYGSIRQPQQVWPTAVRWSV